MRDYLEDREIIIEYRPFGNTVRVSAMDVQTLTEVTIQGPAASGEAILRSNALRKLKYVLQKKGIL